MTREMNNDKNDNLKEREREMKFTAHVRELAEGIGVHLGPQSQ